MREEPGFPVRVPVSEANNPNIPRQITEMVLREYGPGDLGWMISMHGFVYAEQFDFTLQFERDIAEKAVSILNNPDEFDRIWLAWNDGVRAGSIAVSKLADGTAFINFLLVVKEFRKQGIAGRLIDRALSHARQNGVQTIRLETYSCLKAARRLYGNHGFMPCKINRNVTKYGQTFDQEFWEKTNQKE